LDLQAASGRIISSVYRSFYLSGHASLGQSGHPRPGFAWHPGPVGWDL